MAEYSREDVIRIYSGLVYRIAYYQTQSKSDAEDIFQEVFLDYLKSAPEFENEEHRKAWLIRVTVNRCKKLWRTPWRRKTVLVDEPELCQSPAEAAVWEQVALLPQNYRAVLYLYYYEGYSTEEIAGILHLNPPNVRARLTRARKLLKEHLEGEWLL